MKPLSTHRPVHGEEMKAIMNINELNTIAQLEDFLNGTQPVVFSPEITKEQLYAWIQRTLVKFNYLALSKHERGIVRRYLSRVTRYSRQQCTRLILQYRKHGQIQQKCKIKKTSFKKIYTSQDIRLLAKLDELHGTLSGPATKKLCERAFNIFGQQEYERLANVSVSHIYNLRHSVSYTRQRWIHDVTKPKPSSIGERRKPKPNGNPGYIRIDTVHQGDLDGQKGVYHINAVDEVTQFEVVSSVEKISEQYLIPVLEDLLNTFPFILTGFHSDNGSEYINKVVAKLLDKLHIEFTKSRPRHSNDNALAECKNGAIVRKILGYMHIPQHWAEKMNELNKKYLNPYINYHRPCFFAETKIDEKGKERKIYQYDSMMTPYEKFKSLPNAEQFLREDLSFTILDKIATQVNDNDAAKQLKEARSKLFHIIHENKETVCT